MAAGPLNLVVRRLGGSMAPLSATVTDAELLALVDRWAALLEREEYAAAFALTRWTCCWYFTLGSRLVFPRNIVL